MVALLTLDVAKAHLRVDHTDDDQGITDNIEEASEICLTYMKRRGPLPTEDIPEPPEWDQTSLPPDIRAAVKIMLSKLYDDRAAGVTDNEVAMGYLPKTVTSILHRYRDPALA